jgi:hypothetical protein
MQNKPNYTFANLKQAFSRHCYNVHNDEQVYLQLKNLKQESTKRVEVYYERLLKLVNSLQTLTTNSFLTIVL